MIHHLVSPLLLRAGLRHHTRQRWQAALMLASVMMGVAVVVAVDLANARGQCFVRAHSVRSVARCRDASADRHSGLPAAVLYTALLTTPGHPPMAPVISADVHVEVAGRFRLVGIDLFAEGPMRRDMGSTITIPTGCGPG